MQPPSVSIAAELLPKLRLLPAMATCGHLSAAAESIGIPQPTATRWLESLNRTVGLKLTARVGRRVELTPAGHALAEAVAAAEGVLAQGVVRAFEAADPGRGQIVFGFLRTQGASRAPELLRGYRAEHPRVRFSLVQAAHEDLIDRLRAGTIDLALTTLRSTDTGVTATELFREPFVLVAPADHRLAQRRLVRLRDVRDQTLVGLNTGIALRRRVDELFAAAGVRPRYGFETDEVETVRGLAASGIGAAVLPARHGGPLSGSVEIPLSPPQYRSIGLVASSRHRLEPAAEKFRLWAEHRGAR